MTYNGGGDDDVLSAYVIGTDDRSQKTLLTRHDVQERLSNGVTDLLLTRRCLYHTRSCSSCSKFMIPQYKMLPRLQPQSCPRRELESVAGGVLRLWLHAAQLELGEGF